MPQRPFLNILILAGLLALPLALGGRPAVQVTPDVIILFVQPGAKGASCSAWGIMTACELQTALNLAAPGNAIWVAQGVYTPTMRTTPEDARTATFQLKSGVALYGGFDPDNEADTFEERDWQTHPSVLSGDINGDDIIDPNGVVTDTVNIRGENAYHVIIGNSTITEMAVLDGFTITAGNADGDFPHFFGGGMYNQSSNSTLTNLIFSGNRAETVGGGIYNQTSNLTLTKVTFSGNYAGYEGGGMYNMLSSPTLMDVTFSSNRAIFGGGIYNRVSSPMLTDIIFSGNRASQGGGMYNDNSSPTLRGVTFFSNNAVVYGGGGMYNWMSNATLTNVSFSGNSAKMGGGGMWNNRSDFTLINVIFNGNNTNQNGGGMWNGVSDPTLTNVTFFSNSAVFGGGMFNIESYPTLTNVTFSGNDASGGGGMYNAGSDPTLTNTILWGNTATDGAQIFNDLSTPLVSYSDIQGSGGSGKDWDTALGADGGGNIDDDPLFVDAAGGNLRLSADSPAIDAGNNAALPLDITTDLDGKLRFVNVASVPDTGNGDPPIVDMGAYEVQNLVYMPLVKR